MSLAVSDDNSGGTWTEAAELLQEVMRRFDELPDDLESKAEWLTLCPKAMKAFALVVERALDETTCDK